jgi:hypothetical protein
MMRTAAEIQAMHYAAMLKHFDIRERAGWKGIFSTQQSPLAKIANGSRVETIANQDSDTHPLSATGTVLGSVGLPDVGVAYFIEFDDAPKCAFNPPGYPTASKDSSPAEKSRRL